MLFIHYFTFATCHLSWFPFCETYKLLKFKLFLKYHQKSMLPIPIIDYITIECFPADCHMIKVLRNHVTRNNCVAKFRASLCGSVRLKSGNSMRWHFPPFYENDMTYKSKLSYYRIYTLYILATIHTNWIESLLKCRN